MQTESGDDVNVYDYVAVHTLDAGDQIVHDNDLIEVSRLIDSGESIMVKGYSHISGDNVVYILPFDTVVGLWAS